MHATSHGFGISVPSHQPNVFTPPNTDQLRPPPHAFALPSNSLTQPHIAHASAASFRTPHMQQASSHSSIPRHMGHIAMPPQPAFNSDSPPNWPHTENTHPHRSRKWGPADEFVTSTPPLSWSHVLT